MGNLGNTKNTFNNNQAYTQCVCTYYFHAYVEFIIKLLLT